MDTAGGSPRFFPHFTVVIRAASQAVGLNVRWLIRWVMDRSSIQMMEWHRVRRVWHLVVLIYKPVGKFHHFLNLSLDYFKCQSQHESLLFQTDSRLILTVEIFTFKLLINVFSFHVQHGKKCIIVFLKKNDFNRVYCVIDTHVPDRSTPAGVLNLIRSARFGLQSAITPHNLVCGYCNDRHSSATNCALPAYFPVNENCWHFQRYYRCWMPRIVFYIIVYHANELFQS